MSSILNEESSPMSIKKDILKDEPLKAKKTEIHDIRKEEDKEIHKKRKDFEEIQIDKSSVKEQIFEDDEDNDDIMFG